MLSIPALATKLIGLKVIDKDYLMISSGMVRFIIGTVERERVLSWVILSKRVMILCLSLASG